MSETARRLLLNSSDEVLANLYRANSRHSIRDVVFGLLNQRHNRAVVRIVRASLRVLPADSRVDECATDVWVRVAEILPRQAQFRSRGHFFAWLSNIARYVSLEYSKGVNRELASLPEAEAPAVSHENESQGAELRRVLIASYRRLDPSSRRVARALARGAKRRDIAKLLGVSLRHAQRCRQRVINELAEHISDIAPDLL